MTVNRTRRAWSRLLLPVVLLAGVALAGCNTPPLESRVAIRHLGDGRAEVLAMICKGHEVSMIAVYESASDSQGRGWTTGPPVTRERSYAKQTQLLRVKVFDTPAGWETQDGSLTSLAPGVRYGVRFGSVQGQASLIHFTLDDLEHLGESVLTGPDGDERRMSESDFVEAAREECDRVTSGTSRATAALADAS
jgi:hypothetical protein